VRLVLPSEYAAFLEEIKRRIQTAQIQAAQAANSELLSLYWDIGRRIVEKQQHEGWGAKIIDRLAADLQHSFPGLAGFSRSNVYRMWAFYLVWPVSTEIVAQPVRQLGRKVVANSRQSSRAKSINATFSALTVLPAEPSGLIKQTKARLLA